MRHGSRSLGEFPLDVVRIDCPRCDRAARCADAALGFVSGSKDFGGLQEPFGAQG
jgi:hypothetical protein